MMRAFIQFSDSGQKLEKTGQRRVGPCHTKEKEKMTKSVRNNLSMSKKELQSDGSNLNTLNLLCG